MTVVETDSAATPDSVYRIVRLCGYRWTLEILASLNRQPLRFTDLLSTIEPRPSTKSLSEALQRLSREGIVCRVGDDRLYRLTPVGAGLLAALAVFLTDVQRITVAPRPDSPRGVSARPGDHGAHGW